MDRGTGVGIDEAIGSRGGVQLARLATVLLEVVERAWTVASMTDN